MTLLEEEAGMFYAQAGTTGGDGTMRKKEKTALRICGGWFQGLFIRAFVVVGVSGFGMWYSGVYAGLMFWVVWFTPAYMVD